MREKRTSEVSMGYPKQEVHAICAYDFCCFLYKISCTVSEYYFFLMFICLKRFLRKITKQRNLYMYVYIYTSPVWYLLMIQKHNSNGEELKDTL